MAVKLEWLGKYVYFMGALYQAANAYSQICKTECFGDKVTFSPYEIQILEHIMVHEEENRNMTELAHITGLHKATFSKYIKKLENKGLIDRYRFTGNKKNIILKVSKLGHEEHDKYVAEVSGKFSEMFELLGSLDDDDLETFKSVIQLWGRWNMETIDQPDDTPEDDQLIKI